MSACGLMAGRCWLDKGEGIGMHETCFDYLILTSSVLGTWPMLGNTVLTDLENSWNFVNLEISWNFWHDK